MELIAQIGSRPANLPGMIQSKVVAMKMFEMEADPVASEEPVEAIFRVSVKGRFGYGGFDPCGRVRHGNLPI
jgi:hypothetical protein